MQRNPAYGDHNGFYGGLWNGNCLRSDWKDWEIEDLNYSVMGLADFAEMYCRIGAELIEKF